MLLKRGSLGMVKERHPLRHTAVVIVGFHKAGSTIDVRANHQRLKANISQDCYAVTLIDGGIPTFPEYPNTVIAPALVAVEDIFLIADRDVLPEN